MRQRTPSAGARAHRHARDAHGRTRQLRRHPLADRSRRGRGARRGRDVDTPTIAARAASDVPTGESGSRWRGTILTVIREMAEEAESAPAKLAPGELLRPC